MDPSFPPAPWRLKGCALLRLQALPVHRVRSLVPAQLQIVPVLPGRTLGALYLAKYTDGSSLQYHELIVMPALVRQGARLGGWISHIYVDNAVSMMGGREIWGLPKQMAHFDWQLSAQGQQQVRVEQEGLTLCSLNMTAPAAKLPCPVLAQAFGLQGDRLLSFKVGGWSRLAYGSGDLILPAASPFAGHGFSGGRCLLLDRFDLRIGAPRG